MWSAIYVILYQIFINRLSKYDYLWFDLKVGSATNAPTAKTPPPDKTPPPQKKAPCDKTPTKENNLKSIILLLILKLFI